MSASKRFKTSLFGYSKGDVDEYVEGMFDEFAVKVSEKDKEIAETKAQLKEIKTKYDEIQNLSEEIRTERSNIADVFIKAKEKADVIIEEAKEQAIDEKKEIEILIEKEKEKLVDLKAEIRDLKDDVAIVLKKYQNQLENMIPSEASSETELFEDNESEEDKDRDVSLIEEEEEYSIYREDEPYGEKAENEDVESEEDQDRAVNYDEQFIAKNYPDAQPEGDETKSFSYDMNDETVSDVSDDAGTEEAFAREAAADEEEAGSNETADSEEKPSVSKYEDETEEIDKVDELREILEFYTSDEKDYHIK